VRSVLVDRPGFGLSDPATFPRSTFRPCAVRFVTDVLDELRPESGASGGGTWAIWCALNRPERVRDLVLLGSVPLLPGARIPLGIRAMATPVLGDVLSRTVKPGRRMLLRLMSSMGEGDTILRHPDLLDSLIDAAMTRSPGPPTWPSSRPSSHRSARGRRPGSARTTCARWPCPR
jgi:pimeloyl-ACP methyl ester carboxylesterase